MEIKIQPVLKSRQKDFLTLWFRPILELLTFETLADFVC